MRTRKQLLVLSEFQHWFLKVFVAYTAIFLAIFGAGLFLWFKLIVDELLNIAGLLSPTFIQTIHKHMWVAAGVVVAFIVILLAVAAIQALLFSRRIAGPIFAIARHLDKCAEKGRLEPVKLREDDLFMDIADRFNRLAVAVNAGGGDQEEVTKP